VSSFNEECQLKRFADEEIYSPAFFGERYIYSSIDVFFWEDEVSDAGASCRKELVPIKSILISIYLSSC
jgi:hypothetical protein